MTKFWSGLEKPVGAAKRCFRVKVVGSNPASPTIQNECLPRKCHKGVEAPYHKSLQMPKVHEVCGSLPTMGNADNALALRAPLGFVFEI
jgi:hypothetical protein